ncbi:nucleotide sugar dehydrogenase [Streptomyces naganishii]|uniref:UDP-N-acetyl-D-glucosamine dehydrogenase n=1 Tax=Streptomyces naganishii JCM 4654 TaxID=1306179 RepID=A0A918Y9T6_9ACTN|nr:nucleotide sugar dehydrogenase [Streptomyces naganishii]GHD96095.1 UDP-N-acetyl-D-glucosamine dehydrogenase [Streptomyces naganishii JCM 4654]
MRQEHRADKGRLVVVGLGYVGLPLAVRGVEAGYSVVGVDTDELRVKRLNACDSYIEGVSDACVMAAADSGRFRATTGYEQIDAFDVCVITVPTPLREGVPDLSFVECAGRSIAPHLTPGATVILESTTYPGTTESLLRPLLEAGSGLNAGSDFHLGYSPERIDPGNPDWHLENTPKVISGIDAASLRRIKRFYGDIVERTVPVTSCRTAELTKLLENTYRHVNIALVNEMAMVARQLGADIWEAVEAASTKPFGFMPFRPGPGVGGHCLPVDPSYLSWQVKRLLKQDLRFITLANEINDHMPEHVVRRVTRGLNDRGKPVRGSRVLQLGLAYKKNTGDIRESPALVLARSLLQLGAQLVVVEPHTDAYLVPFDITRVELTEAEIRAADAVIVATDHDAFDYELVEEASAYVLDTRNRCRGARVEVL